jgi:hypothetical protein
MTQPGGRPESDSTVRLIVAWGFVGIPLAWGVVQVAVRSLALFR